MSSPFIDRLLTIHQYLIPQHLLSKAMFWLTRLPLGKAGKVLPKLLRLFVKQYGVDMAAYAQTDLSQYPTFNAFFTRALADGARPLAAQGLLSPVDGTISQLGRIEEHGLLQAKGQYFDLDSLFGGLTEPADPFRQGTFATIYLSPKDYHRIHMPVTGKVKQMIYVPGRLFSVSPRTTRAVPGLFARNERLICLFDTEYGPMALILVGAIFVGSIDTI